MPLTFHPDRILTNAIQKAKSVNFMEDFGYNYPNGLDLKPGSEMHTWLVQRILERAVTSRSALSSRHSDWREVDRVVRAFVPPDFRIGNEKDEEDEESIPKIVMPVSYTNLETVLTYFTAAFLQNPIFPYEGVGPEDELGTALLEQVIDIQARKTSMGLALHTMWRDSLMYGFGAVSPVWYERRGRKVVKETQGFTDLFTGAFFPTREVRKIKRRGILYEGHRLMNIDPYMMLPDPSAPIHDIQMSEFIGWIDRTNVLNILSDERDSEGLFNGKYVKQIDGRSAIYESEFSDREHPKNINRSQYNTPVDIIWMYITLIPNDWKLGSSEYPEKWLFALAGDQVLIAAQPLRLDHELYPVVTCAPDYDGYSISPPSRLIVVSDLQRVYDFLYSSHLQNIRKFLNDMIVYDPYLINTPDLDNRKAGKLIRTKRAAWGRPGVVKDAIAQLQVQDVTANHVADGEYLSNVMKDAMGSTDILRGVVGRRGPRVSAEEAGGARGAGLARLEKAAKIISLQAMRPLAYMLASQTQQFIKEETWVKITGETGLRLANDFGLDVKNERVLVDPEDLVVDYDVMEYDGSIPGSQDVRLWQEIFSAVAQNPILMQNLDITRIFTHMARQMGAKNVDRFLIKNSTPTVLPDEEVARQVERGNLVPLNGEQS